jgi:peptidyl-prolyl cis-trans isomerase SurA
LKTETLLLLAMTLASPTALADDRRPVDRVAAVVNGDVITFSELTQRSGAEYRRASDMPSGPARDQARAKALRSAYEAVLTERMVENEVKALGIEVTEAQIDGAIDDVKKRNNLSDDTLKQALASEGMTVTAYRARLRKDFENHLLISAKVQNRVKVTDDDVKGYYQSHLSEFTGEDQVKLRLILLQVPAGASPTDEARVKASGETLLSRLAAGEDFADLARQVSQGPGAASGGDLGWVKRGPCPSTWSGWPSRSWADRTPAWCGPRPAGSSSRPTSGAAPRPRRSKRCGRRSARRSPTSRPRPTGSSTSTS